MNGYEDLLAIATSLGFHLPFPSTILLPHAATTLLPSTILIYHSIYHSHLPHAATTFLHLPHAATTFLPSTIPTYHSHLPFPSTILLGCCRLLTMKLVDLHVLVNMKVVGLALSFKTRFGWPHFDNYSSSYGQITGRWSDTFSTRFEL